MSTTIVGQDVIRKEAWDKVTGRAKYNSDVSFPGLLHAASTSTCAHGRSNAWITASSHHARVRRSNRGLTGSVLEDKPPLAVGKVRYYGEPVALVIADSEAEACAAATRVVVEYEDGSRDSLHCHAARSSLVHEDLASYKHVIPRCTVANTNINNHQKIKGDMDKGWNESEVIVAASFPARGGPLR